MQSSAQQALMGTINTSMQAVQKAQIDLGEVDDLPPLGQDMVESPPHTQRSIKCLFTAVMKPAKCAHVQKNFCHLRLGLQSVDPEQDGRIET